MWPFRKKKKKKLTAKTKKLLDEARERKAQYARRTRDLEFKKQELIVMQEEAKVQLELEKIRTQQLQNELKQKEIEEKLEKFDPIEEMQDFIDAPEDSVTDRMMMGILGGMMNAKQNTAVRTESSERVRVNPHIDPGEPTPDRSSTPQTQGLSDEYLGRTENTERFFKD